MRSMKTAPCVATEISGKDVLVEQAVTYARESVPDAIARLRPSEAVLRRLVVGKLKELGVK